MEKSHSKAVATQRMIDIIAGYGYSLRGESAKGFQGSASAFNLVL